MMTFIETILRIIFGIIEFYLIFNCVYILFFALVGHLKRRPEIVEVKTKRKFCILIPAYKEDVVIVGVALNTVKHIYSGPFDVYVIADGLKDETIAKLRSYDVKVITVQFEKSTKAKALVSAVSRLPDAGYDIGLILDADNIMAEGFLEKVNAAFEAGAISLQAHRVAKNFDTTFALLDACNEEINNHFLRQGHYNVGLGSALIGSGMAFKFDFFKHLLVDLDKVVAEDKEMDIRISVDRVKTVYLADAYVYDEKISSAQVFEKQRSRWIYSQIESLKKNFKLGVVQLFKFGNVDLFDKILQLVILPRTLLLGTLFFMFAQSFINPFSFSALFNGILFLIVCFSLLISLPRKFYNARLWKAIVTMPAVIFYMAKALLKARTIKKGWNHTPHTTAHHPE